MINWSDKMHQCALITTLMSTEPKLTVANMYLLDCSPANFNPGLGFRMDSKEQAVDI